MLLPIVLYLTFTLLATGGLFAILRLQYGWRVAAAWCAALLLSFAALAALLVWLVETGSG